MDDQAFIEELQRDFLDEITHQLEDCEECYLSLEQSDGREEVLTKLFRLAHSIKGTGSAVGFTDLPQFAHVVEDCLTVLRTRPERVNSQVVSLLLRSGDAFKRRVQLLKTKSSDPWDVSQLKSEILEIIRQLESGDSPAEHPAGASPQSSGAAASKAAVSSIKIDPNRIDSVLDLVGELVVIKSQLMEQFAASTHSMRQSALLGLLDKTIRDLQDRTLSMRMTALKPLCLKVQRAIRDLSVKLDKPVEFLMSGEDVELDRNMIELLADPLIHIARNAVDHGIEPKSTRKDSGKPERATILFAAQQSGGRILITLSDDGRGIDRARIVRKAVEKGILPPETTPEMLTERDTYHLLFAPGFSTAETVSDISGRGVGLDVVKSNIEHMKGTVEIESTPGRGSAFRISLPLTTAITDGVIILIDGTRYVLPIDRIQDIVEIESLRIQTLARDSGGRERKMVKVRDRILPYIDMNETLRSSRASRPGPSAVRDSKALLIVVESLGESIALGIEAVQGQSQVVVKPLNAGARKNSSGERSAAGAAILGDGRIALVLDVDGLIQSTLLRMEQSA